MFSVVITTKDRIEFLKRCIASINSNVIKPSEVIIVNDAGCLFDKTIFDDVDLEIKVVNNEVSMGANYCRNSGVDLCSNEIIFFVDDDDAVSLNAFEDRIRILTENDDVGLCYTGVDVVLSDNLNCIVRRVFPKSSNNYLVDLLSKGNIIGSTSRVAIKRKYFVLAGRFDEKLSCLQDYDLWIRMSQCCRIEHDNSTNTVYTIHCNGNQISSKFNKYILSIDILLFKYKLLFHRYNLAKDFESHMFLRVALSASSSSVFYKLKYSLISFYKKPNAKSMFLMFIPYFLLKKIYPFT